MVLGERLRRRRSSMKRWRRGVMATLVEQKGKGTQPRAAGSVRQGQTKRKSVKSVRGTAGKAKRRAQGKKGLKERGGRTRRQCQVSVQGHREAVSFNTHAQRPGPPRGATVTEPAAGRAGSAAAEG